MSGTFTASEVRKWADALMVRAAPTLSGILHAYADRLEADEKAVPVAYYNPANPICSTAFSFSPFPMFGKTSPLYTHPSPSDAEKRDTITPRELAKRIERGEKWKLADEPTPCQSQDAERLAEALRKFRGYALHIELAGVASVTTLRYFISGPKACAYVDKPEHVEAVIKALCECTGDDSEDYTVTDLLAAQENPNG